MREAGCVVVGGHSVRDKEIKFGYAVTGLVHPDGVLTNAGARPGDKLIFTKRLGTGVITTALKAGRADTRWVEAAIESMTLLNRRASEVVTGWGDQVHGMTDVTGFGFIGHAREMAVASRAKLEIRAEAVPVLDGALECIGMDTTPAGLRANREFAECMVDTARPIREELRTLLFDPQTAGGLLIAIDPQVAEVLVAELRAEGYPAAEVGAVFEGAPRIVLC